MSEENNDWKWIDGLENMYRIYRNGDVESVKRKYVPNNKILKPFFDRDGYKNIKLCKDNKKKNFKIHRLIAIYFIPNPNKFTIIDHIDGNPLNNSIENLRWISHSGNNRNRKSRGSSKYRGVSWDKQKGKWVARIIIDGKNKNLGRFDDEKEAHEVYMVKHNEMMEEFEKL